MSRFTPRRARDWRRWLEKNHRRRSEVWLVFYKKHTGKPTISYNEAVEEALCFGWIDSVKRSLDGERYAFRFTPRKPGSKWSPSNICRAEKLIAEGRMEAAGLELVADAKRTGAWDDSAGAPEFDMPPEFRCALSANPKAKAVFETLPPSQSRQYIGWIASARRPETREKRLARAIELLTSGGRLGMV